MPRHFKKKRMKTALKRLRSVGVLNMFRLARRRKNKHVAITQPVISYMDSLAERTFDSSLIGLWRESESFSMSSMQIDITEAAFIRFLVRMTGARRALEAGTFRGWSTAVIASALVPCDDARVITIQLRPEEGEQAKGLWARHLDPHILSRIDMRMGNARSVMKDLVSALPPDARLSGQGEGLFDIIFIDADKSGYEEYISCAKALVRKGGVIVLDNMLNAGLVATSASDNTTRAVRAANEISFGKEGIEAGFSPLIIPAWDGVVILVRD